ncbi:MAG: AraC family transcriptional regulator [Chitinophagaceae bacterium]|nr:AraC family transcriptional regulator [Chitinophagaceae bacterium]
MIKPSLDQWTTLFLLGAVQGLFLSILLFIHKKGNRKANTILAFVLLFFSVMMMYYVAYWSGYAAKYTWMNFWIEPFTFLYGPLIYIYLLTLETGQLPKKYALHFIPAIIQFLFLIPLIIRNTFGRVEWLRVHFFSFGSTIDTINLLFTHLQNISLVVYGIAIFLFLRNDYHQLNKYALKEEHSKHNWLKKIAWLYAGFTVAVWSYWTLAWSGLIKVEYDYLISFSMTVFIYTVGYLGFRQPEIFNGIVSSNGKKQEVKYARSSLKEEHAKASLDKLLSVMETEKPFLDSNLKIQQLAEKAGVSSHHLSQIINESMNQNYADFINSYRINEARRLLLAPDYGQEKILSIAFDSGFQNKATFNAAFKKYTGMSPTEYKKYHQRVLAN